MKGIFGAFRGMEEGDFRVLSSIESGQRRREFVPKDDVRKYSKLDLANLEYRLKRLDGLRLIHSRGSPYEGYRLNPRAYDFLALNAFVQRDTIESIGMRIAVGKESEIYEAMGPDGSELVVKFHRLGMQSFHRAARLRSYIGKRRHISWIYAARLAAEREFEALVRLKDLARVPRAVDQNRDAIIMSKFEGCELSDARLDDPVRAMNQITENVGIALKEGIIHGDLSEFNVMVGQGDLAIIDWPQWVDPSHPQASSIYERDLGNIFNFFRKKCAIDTRNMLSDAMGSTGHWSRRNTS
jgi:RIO kinase 2